VMVAAAVAAATAVVATTAALVRAVGQTSQRVRVVLAPRSSTNP
jgi:lipopolysaccharide export system protein LptA